MQTEGDGKMVKATELAQRNLNTLWKKKKLNVYLMHLNLNRRDKDIMDKRLFEIIRQACFRYKCYNKLYPDKLMKKVTFQGGMD